MITNLNSQTSHQIKTSNSNVTNASFKPLSLHICAITCLLMINCVLVIRIRREQTPPPLTLTGDISLLSDAEGKTFNIVDRDNVSILLSPELNVCQHNHIFIITSAPQNIRLRNKGICLRVYPLKLIHVKITIQRFFKACIFHKIVMFEVAISITLYSFASLLI